MTLISLRDIWVLPSIAVAALAAGYGCVAAFGFFTGHSDQPVNPVIVQPLPLVKAPAPPRFAPDDRVKLARAIQTELARVGCYRGAMDGLWTPATRSAMQAFVDSVNARLPTDAPDEILLSLVDGHRTSACGTPSTPAPPAARAEAIVITAPAAPYRVAGDAPSQLPEFSAAQVAASPSPSQIAKAETAVQPPRPVTVEPVAANAEKSSPDGKDSISAVLANVELLDGKAAAPAREPTTTSALPAAVVGLAAPAPEYASKPRKRSQRRSKFSQKQPKFMKSFIRSVNKTLSSFGF